MKEFTIRKIQQSLENKEITCQKLVTSFFAKIKKDKLNNFITLFTEDALKQAQEVDQKIAQGKKLKNLEGIPVAIKDNILIKDRKATAASQILENYIATYDAQVIKKLKSAGAIFLGKTNLDEFAMGASNENSYFGPALNPHDHDRVTGGSSGGSAAAVAAQHCVFALGSDTGGSIRQPASFCGVVGFKPSYGRVSRQGLMSLASSLDQIGPLTNSVEDAVLVYNTILGKDDQDMTSMKTEKVDLSKIKKLSVKRVGIPKNYYELSIDQGIKDIFKDNIEKLKGQGLEIKEIDLSFMDEALAIYYIIQSAEASTNLARYDGLRYGKSVPAKDLTEQYINSRGLGFGKEVKRRIIMGTYVLSYGYREAYYNQAKKVQEDIKLRFDQIFQKVDAIIIPTTPSTAFKLNEKFNDPLTMYLADIFTVAVNMAGLPAISVPSGLVDNLPVGLQVLGNFKEEKKVFNLAYQMEKL
ncbi:Asp-tRNA(Asn)/Glu-tRNA(Gln) amidotransferase subunit GatA [bacterium]|nr:Asp-tRNA(Asn)/Glu-tRNA(Gln) amidotransferase subunit GatA [bacterium]